MEPTDGHRTGSRVRVGAAVTATGQPPAIPPSRPASRRRTLLIWLQVIVVGVAVAVAAGVSLLRPSTDGPQVLCGPARYPLRVAENARYLVDQDGHPEVRRRRYRLESLLPVVGR